MSLIMRRIFSSVCFKNFLNFNDSHLIRAQYYTSLTSSNYVNSLTRKSFDNQLQISSLKAVRELNFDITKGNRLLLKTFDKIFFISKPKQMEVGFLWYKTLDEISIEEFVNLLEIPDTFFSWFKVVELHVWMLLFRMSQDKHKLKYIRDGVVEAMWMDMETRAKIVGKFNKNFKKNFKSMYEDFRQQSIFWYDHGYLEDDKMLATIVWSNFFERNCDDPVKIEALVRYIRYQMKHLDSFDTETLDLNASRTGVWKPFKPFFQNV